VKLTTVGNGYLLTDETGASIQIEDEDELYDVFRELEKHFGASDPEVRYRELTEQLARLTKVVEELKQ
jgi:hypothetical protein